MRIALALLLICGLAYGQTRYVRDFTADTNGVASVTYEAQQGELHAILLSTPTAVTGTVSVAYTPLGQAAVVLATNVVVQARTFYPAVYLTDSAGTSLTNHPPVRYILTRDDVTVNITGAPSESEWRSVIIVK